MRSLSVRIERWPIAGSFTISRGAKTEAAVIVAEIADGDHRGRGECVPYARYGETLQGVADAIMAMSRVSRGLDRLGLQEAIGPGAARNAVDCALWDLAAKQSGEPVHRLAGLPAPAPVTTAYTISLAAPELMAVQAAEAAARPLLKVKLGAAGDAARIAAVRRAAPNAELIVDANEGWSAEMLSENLAACAQAGVTLIEQPLPAGGDDILARIRHPVPLCADESVHARPSLDALRDKYEAVNIKLDKAGGLTEALATAAEAQRLGFVVMVGSMVATSLAVAPAVLVAQRASLVDLDGPLLLERDRPRGLRYDGSLVYPATPALWG
ncbi:MAG TPA: N-acetyl-D-Glu racemase DgcA [Xanthobacteraceae bacterium]|jgi:L-alanine-DL-glutamate epimerase-like enolase superfamily enzyme